MPKMFSAPSRISDLDMHHGTCVTHVPWCMPRSLPSSSLWSRRRGKTFPTLPALAQPVILRHYVSGKRPIATPPCIYSVYTTLAVKLDCASGTIYVFVRALLWRLQSTHQYLESRPRWSIIACFTVTPQNIMIHLEPVNPVHWVAPVCLVRKVGSVVWRSYRTWRCDYLWLLSLPLPWWQWLYSWAWHANWRNTKYVYISTWRESTNKTPGYIKDPTGRGNLHFGSCPISSSNIPFRLMEIAFLIG